MYVIFKSGGKQYKVTKGQIISIEKINNNIYKKIFLNKILMIYYSKKLLIGNPFINGAKIIAKIISHFKNNKILIFKFKRRKHYKKCQGHRQYLTNIKIIDILLN